MSIPYNQITAYAGPALIHKTEFGADAVDYATWRAAMMAAGTFPANNYVSDYPDAAFVTDPFLADQDVLHLASLEDHYDFYSDILFYWNLDFTNNGSGNPPDADGRKIIWCRALIAFSPDYALVTSIPDTGATIGPTLGPFIQNSPANNNGAAIALYPNTQQWGLARGQNTSWPGFCDDVTAFDATADIALAKTQWCAVIMKIDISGNPDEPYGWTQWFNDQQRGSFTCAADPDFVELGGLNFFFSAGIDINTYLPLASGSAYVRLVEYIDGEIDPDPYGFSAGPTDCETGWRVTFFEDDDVTPLFADAETDPSQGDGEGNVFVGNFYTSASCPRPYLKWPHSISETEINFQEGSSVIGGMTVEIVDKRRDPTDQTTGIVTSVIEKLRDARCLVEYFYNDEWQVVMDGAVQNISLSSLVTYSISIRDIRERERDVKLFATNETWSIYPEKGSVNGYGYPVGDGAPLLPPAAVLTGDFVETVDAGGRRRGYVEGTDFFEKLDPDVKALGDPTGTTWSQIVVRWRPAGGTDNEWVYLRDATIPGVGQGANIFIGENVEVTGDESVYSPPSFIPGTSPVQIVLEGDTADLPADGTSVDVQVLARTTTEATPFVWEGSFGELIRGIYNGDFSDSIPRIRYDEARMAELEATTPGARIWLTEPVDDMRTWLEDNVYKVLGMAPVVNERGVIYPITYEVPASGTVLPILDDDSIHIDASWEADGIEGAVSDVEFTYIREYRVPVVTTQEVTEKKKFLGIDFLARDKTVTIENTTYQVGQREVRNVFPYPANGKGKKLVYKPVTLRVLGNVAGQSLTGDTLDESGAQIAYARAHDALRRWPYLTPRLSCRARGGDTVAKALKVGDWCRVKLSWLPDPNTGVRGCDRMMQVIARRPPAEDGWIYFSLIDGGPAVEEITDNLTVSPDPFFDSDGVPTVTVTAVPTGYTGRIEMAISETEPSEFSPLWQPLAPDALALTATGDYKSSFPVPVGRKVWTRWRIEKVGEQPGPWSAPIQVGAGGTETNIIAALLRTSISIDFDSGDVTVTWAGNSVTDSVRLYLDTHADGTAPTFGGYSSVAASGSHTFTAAVTLGDDPVIASVKFVPYNGATAGQDRVRSARYPGYGELPPTITDVSAARPPYAWLVAMGAA